MIARRVVDIKELSSGVVVRCLSPGEGDEGEKGCEVRETDHCVGLAGKGKGGGKKDYAVCCGC